MAPKKKTKPSIEGKERGTNVTPSKEAHALMVKNANESNPRVNLREYLNIIHGLPKEL